MLDTICTTLGARPNDRTRVWVEDSFERLTRQGWQEGALFEPRDRPGYGLVFNRCASGRYRVSQRRGRSLFSFESKLVTASLPVLDVRVRVSVNAIAVMPRLRIFSIRKQRQGQWSIEGDRLLSPSGAVYSLDTAEPLKVGRDAASVRAQLTEDNLVVATELLGNVLAPRVELDGDPLLTGIAARFLQEGDYTELSPGVYVR